jgi:hypothetical protein
MTRKLSMLVAITALGALGLSAAVRADESAPAPRGTMRDESGMMGMMTQMTPDQVKQMTGMVDTCNRMMASMSGEGGNMQHPSASPR